MSKTCIKICGLTTVADSLSAVEAGADCLGLVFVPDTPRCVSMAQAKVISGAVHERHPGTPMIGVFQNQDADFILAAVQEAQLDGVQLHGDEPPEFIAELAVPVIRVLQVSPDVISVLPEKIQAVLPFLKMVPKNSLQDFPSLLLDTPKDQPNREIEDSPAMCDLFAQYPMMLAGGLTPENVGERIVRFRPAGVDVASGVESMPGQKDIEKMRKFCQVVRAVNPNRPVQFGAK